MTRKKIRYALAGFWAVVLAWLLYSMQARGFPQAVTESSSTVAVETSGEAIRFTPRDDTVSAGLIFYPGALVDPEAYAPLARALADSGYHAVVVKVPFRMDAFDWQWEEAVRRTEAVLSGSSGVRWVLGGHSRGGRMAARLAGERPQVFDGLLLIGTSHPRRDDLSSLTLDVTKVFGTEDGLASAEEVRQFARNLPAHTRFVPVEGGNHRQFGYYGWQPGDGRATIDRETQLRETVAAVLAQLRRVEERMGSDV